MTAGMSREDLFKSFSPGGGQTIEFYLTDSLAAMRGMSRVADVIVTSPPYNMRKEYGVHMDNMSRGDYLNWMASFGEAAGNALSEDGSLFLNLGGRPEDPWLPWEAARAAAGGMKLQNVIHWIKSIAIDASPSGQGVTVGHFKPISSRRFLSDCHEYVFHFTRSGSKGLEKLAIGVPYKDKSNIGRWKSALSDVRDRGNVWFIPYETIRSRSQRPHPATFPSRLPEMCIRLHGVRKGMLVLDPFNGIGSTALACLRLGVSYAGFEIDEGYLRESCSRVEAALSSSRS